MLGAYPPLQHWLQDSQPHSGGGASVPLTSPMAQITTLAALPGGGAHHARQGHSPHAAHTHAGRTLRGATRGSAGDLRRVPSTAR